MSNNDLQKELSAWEKRLKDSEKKVSPATGEIHHVERHGRSFALHSARSRDGGF